MRALHFYPDIEALVSKQGSLDAAKRKPGI
jgi:hypothetical protein